jgi:xylulokinase
LSETGPTKYVLAIDLGSSGPKVALVSDRGEMVAHARETVPTHFLSDGGAEQDPDDWWRAITTGVRQVLDATRLPVGDVIGVTCTGQWSVTVPVDGAGHHLMRAVHWMDTRGAKYTKQITDGLPRVAGYGLRKLLRWIRITGGVPTHSGNDALAHILYIKHDRPDVYRQARALLEPTDYLGLRLTGRVAATQATIYPCLLTDNRDLTRVNYDPGLLAWTGVDRAKLPDLVPVMSVLGLLRPEVASEWGLGPNVQVTVGCGDTSAAAVGSGAVDDYDGHICIGTSSWLTCHVPFKKTNIFDYLATMPAAIPGRNLVVAEQGPAGKCFELFVEKWFFVDEDAVSRPPDFDRYRQAEQLAESASAGSDGLIFLPWLNGAGPPTGDAFMRGGFLNQSLRTGRAQALRAVLEGVAYNLKWLLAAEEKFVGRRFAELKFSGGGARSELLCQILADVLDRPIRQIHEPNHAIVRGAAYLALIALGRLRLDDVPKIVRVNRTFTPSPQNRRVYDEVFAEFLRAYRANKPLFARLNTNQGAFNQG